MPTNLACQIEEISESFFSKKSKNTLDFSFLVNNLCPCHSSERPIGISRQRSHITYIYIYIYVFVYIAPYLASRPIWCRCFGPVFLFFLLPINSPSLFLVHVYPPLSLVLLFLFTFFLFLLCVQACEEMHATAVAENHGCTQPIL